MSDHQGPRAYPAKSALITRFVAFFILWMILIGTAPKHWPFGLVAAFFSTWTSLRLWPASTGLSLPGIAGFVLRFLPQSAMAGFDVARRAFSPDTGLRPGIVTHEGALPPGMARDGLTAVMSLQPGKLPVGDTEGGALLVHCLDTTQPVIRDMEADEAAYLRMFRPESAHG